MPSAQSAVGAVVALSDADKRRQLAKVDGGGGEVVDQNVKHWAGDFMDENDRPVIAVLSADDWPPSFAPALTHNMVTGSGGGATW
jgi:hypothetical protein